MEFDINILKKMRGKRWLLLGIIGLVCICCMMCYIFTYLQLSFSLEIAIILGILGLIMLYFAMKNLFVYSRLFDSGSADKKVLAKGPKVVVIGGGTGLSVLLRGLKLYTSNITAIVTVADDGGGSGKLREDLGMLPPGDIRSCILALAETEPTMEKLLQYRFQDGDLKGQSFGNLFIASMNGISNNFEEAIQKISDVLRVTGRVLPVTLDDITLYAKLDNGNVIKGESNIPTKSIEQSSQIKEVFIKPQPAKAVQEGLDAIEEADIIVLGPGSLYTSIIPNLLVQNIEQALYRTTAIKVYIPNIMTQFGETSGFTIYPHVEAILKHCKTLELDYVIANIGTLPEYITEKYKLEYSQTVIINERDKRKLKSNRIELIEGDLIEIRKDYIRHDAIKLSGIIVELAKKEKKKFFSSLVEK